MKKILITSLSLALTLSATAQVKTHVTTFRQAGPFAVAMPYATDTVDVKGKPFDEKTLLDGIALSAPAGATFSGDVLPTLADSRSAGVLSFYLNNTDYLRATIAVKGPRQYRLYVDGKENTDGKLDLSPEHHTIALKYLTTAGTADSLCVVIDAPRQVPTTVSERHPYMTHDLLDGHRVRTASLSPDGSCVLLGIQTTERGGKSRWQYELRDTKTQRLLTTLQHNAQWMPRSRAFVTTVKEGDRHIIYKVDPLSGERTPLVCDVPEGRITVSPAEDYLIITATEKGPKEDADIYEVTEMDDRQPGFRDRTYLVRCDLATGICQRITFGSKGDYLMDIAPDASQLLIANSRSRLSRRPTSVSDVVLMDARTLHVDTLLTAAEFTGPCCFSPDGRQLLITGTPEAFGRIGCQLPANVIPSMTENELFLFDIATKKVTPLTRDFDPSIVHATWAKADGQVYFNAEDRDSVNLFVLNPKTGRIAQLPAGGENVFRFDIAAQSATMTYLSHMALAPASAYVMNLKTLRQQTFFDGQAIVANTDLGTCQRWNFINSRGDTVYGTLHLPANFDASRKYPMIVSYYGGCAPSSRQLESRYPLQYWTSLGYVVYQVQPSGATGFGQEWASRHVNTAGKGPAEDIIEGTRKICEEHPFIDSKHIGCIGASYGGFMTQYLQTQTDIFAAAISHAGITNHTSYWGVGYWGYNYSEVSMANSYPWSHRQLYVDQSPLFNADKIHTPLLLLHGDADTNVPPMESLQMFAALKLLGREVALVEVTGQNHHILDYTKRIKWMDTQMAWFQKWLKGDASWWDALYPKKHF